jgi:hypothetical protein
MIEISLLSMGVMGESGENTIDHFSKNEGLFENRHGFERMSKGIPNQGVCLRRGQDASAATP